MFGRYQGSSRARDVHLDPTMTAFARQESTAAPRRRPRHRASALVLVVDDDEAHRELTVDCLRLAGLATRAASSVHEALTAVASAVPDLIVSDVSMPDSDGFSLVDAVRAQPESAAVPIVLMSARDTSTQRLRGWRAGVDGFIAKPFEPDELLALVENVLARGRRCAGRRSRGRLAGRRGGR